MSTKSKAFYSTLDSPICQGDIYKNVRYSYIETEDDESVSIVEFEFPYAIIISQACDVIAMEEIIQKNKGKATKFMPSVLMCPIYDKTLAKRGQHIEDVFTALSINMEDDSLYQKEDYKVAQRDWHYRFHALTICIDDETIMENTIVDFKHYISLPMHYLIKHKTDRLYHLDDLFAEQLTLKFATYLSRVAIP